MTHEDYEDWTMDMISNWKSYYPDLAEDYYFDKIIYYKIPLAHNVTIERDRKLFQDLLPLINETWEKVEYYRNHPKELNFVEKIADKRKKFYRMNTKFEINQFPDGKNINEKKIPFLNDVLTIQNNDSEDDVDFIDSD
jgi:hypothetical protein